MAPNGTKCWQTVTGRSGSEAPTGPLKIMCPAGYVIHNGTCSKLSTSTNFRDRDCASYRQDQNNCESGWLADGST